MISTPIYTSTGSSTNSINSILIQNPNNFEIIGILICITLVGTVVVIEKKTVRLIFDALLSDHSLKQSFKDKITYSNRGTLLLFINYIISFGLLVFVANKNNNFVTLESIQLVSITAGLVFFGFVIKRIVILLSGVITGLQPEIKGYLFNHSIYTLAAGILLIPLLILLSFTTASSVFVLQSSFVFLILFMGLRVVKSASLGIKHQIGSLFYIFLYICTLEILPLVVLYKAFMSLMT